MPISANKYAILILLLIANTLLISCRNKEKERLTRENVARLGLQNEIIKQSNLFFRAKFDEMMKTGEIKIIYDYKSSFDNLYRETDLCLAAIDSAKRRASSDGLYTYYLAIQHSIKNLERVLGPFYRITDSTGFTSLNEQQFRSRYAGSSDSFDVQNKLLLLESDVLINHRQTIQEIIKSSTFGLSAYQPIAIAKSYKPMYKKGEQLEIVAFLARRERVDDATATFDGHKMTGQDGFFEYSRQITEQPGTYKIKIEIHSAVSGYMDTYPAVVTYAVR